MTSTDKISSRAGPREWLGLAILALPTLLVAIDMTVLHLAVPSITTALEPSSTQMLWIVDIYGFMIAGLLISMGTIGDRIGRRHLLMIGTAAFGVASMLAAFAASPEMLILARALLGITAATLMPSTLSLITNMFADDGQRGLAIALWSSVFMAGTAAGPLLGGVLLEHFWWGSVFLLNVPLTLVVLIAAPLLLPEHRSEKLGRIDLPSAALLLAGMLGGVYGIKQIAAHGADLQAWAFVVPGAALIFTFARRQLRLSNPMIDLTLFRIPAFSSALGIQFLAIFSVGAPYFPGSQYLQLVLGLSPLDAGLAMLPATVAGIVGAIAASKLAIVMRPAPLITLMLGVGAAGLALLAGTGNPPGLPLLVTGLTLATIGSSAAMTLTVNLIVSAAPPERAGEASGLSETSGEFGMALGIAVLGSLSVAVYRSQVAADLPADLPPNLANAAQDSLGMLAAALNETAHPVATQLSSLGNAAFANGMAAVALAGSGLMVVLAGISMAFLRRARSD